MLMFIMNFLEHPGRIVQCLIKNIEIRKIAHKMLEYQGGLPYVSERIKPVYFIGRYGSIAFKLGGFYMIEALREAGIKAYPGYRCSLKNIYNSIVVIVKDIYEKVDMLTLKKNGNKIILDIHDNYSDIIEGANNYIDLADYILFPNHALLEKISQIKGKIPSYAIMYGYPDPAISSLFIEKGYRTFEEIRCCYFGYIRNVDMEIIELLKKEVSVTIVPATLKNIDKLINFNMHIDIRKNEEDTAYKPLTKILIAAECNANILIEKTPRVLELLPPDYPFFISASDKENDIKRIKLLFNTEKWSYGLSIMENIRKKYSFRNHIISFIKILEEL